MMRISRASVVAALCLSVCRAIPIDNGVDGEPEIECGPTAITVNLNTESEFEGHVFVKGRYDEPDCRNDQIGRRVAGISLPFSTCGVRRARSLNPKGVFVSTTVIITFHPQFITKVDRAYTIECFYMEADKTVSAEIEVSMLTTAFRTDVVPMPICRYEILDGGPTGQPISYALIGQQVYHKWTCDTDTVDTFCMVVQSCFIDDGGGDTVDLIDPNGCALDRYLLNNLEYPTDLMAGQDAHIFKYADRPATFFQCQISITVKEPNEDCRRPECRELERGKRAAATHTAAAAVADVTFGPFSIADVADAPERRLDDAAWLGAVHADKRLCLSAPGLVFFVCLFVAIGLSAVLSALLCCRPYKRV